MKKVYSSDNFPLVGHLKSVLESHNVYCFIKNEHLVGGAGELPPTECWPELWIADDEDVEYVKRILDDALARSEHEEPGWWCKGCGEFIEGQFGVCWGCGCSRD